MRITIPKNRLSSGTDSLYIATAHRAQLLKAPLFEALVHQPECLGSVSNRHLFRSSYVSPNFHRAKNHETEHDSVDRDHYGLECVTA
jgi:hypothetical protein